MYIDVNDWSEDSVRVEVDDGLHYISCAFTVQKDEIIRFVKKLCCAGQINELEEILRERWPND